MDINPYAPSDLPAEHYDNLQDADALEQHYWRDDVYVVLRLGADLPPRCIMTNLPADTYVPLCCVWNPLRARLTTWLGPWMPLAWRRYKTPVNLYLPMNSGSFARARLIFRIGATLAVVCLLLTPTPWLFHREVVEKTLTVLLLTSSAAFSLAVGVNSVRKIKIHDVHDAHIWLQEAGHAFLASLPRRS